MNGNRTTQEQLTEPDSNPVIRVEESAAYRLVIPVLLFCLSLMINYILFDSNRIIGSYPDSLEYINLSDEILNFKDLNISSRFLGYPLYLASFKILGLKTSPIYCQLLLGALVPVFIYLIISALLKNKLLSFCIAFFLSLDYHVISFQSIYLTESLSVFLLAFSVYLHLLYFKKNFSRKVIVIAFLIDFCLLFIRPIFILYPAAMCFITMAGLCLFDRKALKGQIVLLSSGIFINVILILLYSSLVFYRYGFWGVSDISDINMLGKCLQYKYVQETIITEDAPLLIQETYKIYNKHNTDDPWNLKDEIKAIDNGGTNNLKAINSFYIKKNFNDYLKNSFALIPHVMNTSLLEGDKLQRHFYLRKSPKLDNKVFYSFDLIFIFLSQFRFCGVLIGFVAAVCYLLKRQRDKFFTLIYCLSSVLYVIGMSAFFGYGEYVRLRISVEPFLTFFSIFPFVFVIRFSLNMIRNIFKIEGRKN